MRVLSGRQQPQLVRAVYDKSVTTVLDERARVREQWLEREGEGTLGLVRSRRALTAASRLHAVAEGKEQVPLRHVLQRQLHLDELAKCWLVAAHKHHRLELCHQRLAAALRNRVLDCSARVVPNFNRDLDVY